MDRSGDLWPAAARLAPDLPRTPRDVPSHDTFRRVLGLLDRQQFAACLFQWTGHPRSDRWKLLAIDGKAARVGRSRRSPARPCCTS
ncbi:MAG: transposase family protein [Planctomycetaceae bacterium]